MNERIMRAAGFGKEVDAVREGRCPFCGKTIDPLTEFRDGLSYREFRISGLCQSCQDETFKAPRKSIP